MATAPSTDPRPVLAHEAHRLAGEYWRLAKWHYDVRNRLIRELRAEDPKRWTYKAIAEAVECSPELVTAVVKRRVGANP